MQLRLAAPLLTVSLILCSSPQLRAEPTEPAHPRVDQRRAAAPPPAAGPQSRAPRGSKRAARSRRPARISVQPVQHPIATPGPGGQIHSVRVHIVDRDSAGGTKRQSFLLRLDGHAPARVEMHGRPRSIELGVQRQGPAHAQSLAFHIERRDHGPDGAAYSLQLRAHVRMRPGARATVAQLEHPDGSSTNVSVEAR